MLKFQNKTSLITGSGTGIGQAIAKKFVENGASVIILGRRREPLDETSKMLESIKVHLKDVVDSTPDQLVDRIKGYSLRNLKNDNVTVDNIVNNAGVSGPVTCFPNASLDEFKSTIGARPVKSKSAVQALKVMKEGGKIITISTFFTEEKPLEQRPYRFRSPYTAAQGAKNRLAELMSWELTDKGIISIATNPGPVHSDRIYKTVYPKAAAEFMRVGGFEDLNPTEVDAANKELLSLLGENDSVIKEGIANAATKLYCVVENVEKVLAIELMNATQALVQKI